MDIYRELKIRCDPGFGHLPIISTDKTCATEEKRSPHASSTCAERCVNASPRVACAIRCLDCVFCVIFMRVIICYNLSQKPRALQVYLTALGLFYFDSDC